MVVCGPHQTGVSQVRYAHFLLGMAIAAGTGSAALAQGKQDFTLTNATGYDISHVYVSANNDDDWGDDIMGKDVLADGNSVPITFAKKENVCKWDLRVTYQVDDSKVVWRGFDLCQISKITIKYNKATDTTSATTE